MSFKMSTYLEVVIHCDYSVNHDSDISLSAKTEIDLVES